MNYLLKLTPLVVASLFVVQMLGACGQDPVEDSDATTDSAVDSDPGDSSGDSADSDVDDGLCEPGTSTCSSARTYLVCSEDGESRTQIQCDEDLGCYEGQCAPLICEPHEITQCIGDTALETCNFSGTAWITEECPRWWTCEGAGCVEPPCTPGTHRCEGLETILTCNPATGEYVQTDTCPVGSGCFEDRCQELCEISEKVRDYVGCEYWSVDLDNLGEAEAIEHTVVLGNPSDVFPAAISVTDPNGDTLALENSVVEPLSTLVIRFPPDRGLLRAGVTEYSWRINSTVPVTAHQFNPLDNFTDPFTNDGTLLLPTHATGQDYFVMSWVHRAATIDQLNGFVSVVSVNPEGAEITVQAVTNTLVGEGEPNLTPDEERTWTLEYGHTLTLQTAGIDDDLTGTRITSDADIAVFAGHECANVVLGVDRCDHMETQLLPVELLRSEYIATKYQPRTSEGVRSEPDFWRVLAVDGATVLHTDPEIPDIDGAIIATGEWLEIQFRTDFRIWADRPIMLAHYMVGSNWTGIPRECFDDTGPATGIGDPAMTQLIPMEQFRDNYIITTPFAYVQDYVNLAVPTLNTASVRIDDQPVADSVWSEIADGEWSAARVLVPDGPHRITADVPFGLDAYGYSCHVSYAYPGGLNLDVLE